MSETSPGLFEVHPGVGASTATRVLLVEDDEGDAFLVRELLTDAAPDIAIERVRTLAEAGVLLPGRFDCVLLDLGLPDAAGLEALRMVMEAAPSLAVLVLTGLADEFRGMEAVAAGAQDYLVKGNIDGELLRRAIRYAVERKRADESIRRLYESEARAAENARLERGLLPQPLVSGHGVRVVARYTPGRHQSVLGGDFYDVVECEDGALFVLIGDVAGHGPDEAALGVCLRIAWRTLVLAGVDPETILPSMAAVLASERASDEVFATVSMARVDLHRGVARFWLGGHPLPHLVVGSTVTSLPVEATGIALGIDDRSTWTGVDVDVQPDTSLLMFTDGLIEGFASPDHEARLGDEGMLELLSERLVEGHRGRDLVEGLLQDVRARNGGDLTDDVAILLVNWSGE
ncbi:MAG: PP2C family protein-serine/threonine phosphatase [Actinomycetes bacterium]